jgi:hypothetical protein
MALTRGLILGVVPLCTGSLAVVGAARGKIGKVIAPCGCAGAFGVAIGGATAVM